MVVCPGRSQNTVTRPGVSSVVVVNGFAFWVSERLGASPRAQDHFRSRFRRNSSRSALGHHRLAWALLVQPRPLADIFRVPQHIE